MSSDEALCLLIGAVPVSVIIGVVVGRLMPNSLGPKVTLLERKVDHLHKRLQAIEDQPAPIASVAAVSPVLSAAAPSPVASEAVDEPSANVPDDVARPPSTDPAAPQPPTERPPTETPPTPQPAAPPFQFPSIEKLAVWIGASLGALLLAAGGLFAIVAAVEAGWFGPGLRVGTALTAGTLAWLGGALARNRAPVASSGLSAAGASTVFGAVWAATSLYHLVPTAFGFALLAVVVVTTMAQAARFHDRFLGNLAVVGGLLASLVVDGDGAAPKLLYAIILNGAVVALAARRNWFELVAVVGLGTGLQLLGFAAQTSPDHQVAALIGITLLTVPHALLAGRKGLDPLWFAGAMVAAGYMLCAAPWVPALDEGFWDPRTGMQVMTQGSSPLSAAIGLLLLGLPLWLAARRSNTWLAAGAGALAILPSVLAFAAGWPADELARTVVPVVLATGLTLLFAGRRDAGHGLLPLLMVLPLTLPTYEGAAGPAGVALLALTLILTASGLRSTWSGIGALVLVPTGLAAAIIAGNHETVMGVGPLVLGLTVIAVLPVLRRWEEPLPQIPWLGALLAPTVMLPAAYLWWDGALGESVIGLLPLVMAAITLIAAALLVRIQKISVDGALFAVAVLGILGGVTLALPLQLQERWLTVGWALESAALALLSGRLRHPIIRGASIALGVAVAVRLLVNPWALSWGDAAGWPILNWTLYTWGIPTVCLLVAAHALMKNTPENSIMRAAPVVLQLLAMLTGFALINVQVSQAFQDSGPLELAGATMLQGMVRSLSWGGYGTLLLVTGLFARSRMTRIIGFAFILLGALKVCLYDLWSLPGLIRVGSLVGLGLFLVVAAFLFERLVLREHAKPSEGV